MNVTTQHTPGPWTVSELYPSGNKAEDLIFIEPNIAYIERKISGHDQNDMADAVLIAAAPELLKALESITYMCEMHGDFRNGVTDPTGSIDEGNVIAGEIITKARAAIAKAGGAA